MATVSGRDGIRYGVGLLGWIVVVGLVGAGIAGVGLVIAGGGWGLLGTLLGPLLFVLGGLITVAGLFGLLYKVVVDAVQRGMASG